MPLPPLIKRHVELQLNKYCDRRIPPHIRDELRLAFRIEDTAVSLFEERPAFRDPSHWIEIPVAKFRYYNGLKEWRLFWRDRNGKWHNYNEVPPARRFENLLVEVDEDPTGIFWG